MAMGYGKASLVTLTLANGRTPKLMAMVYINGKTVTGMKVLGLIA